jgi:hypothetical protein
LQKFESTNICRGNFIVLLEREEVAEGVRDRVLETE